MLISHFSSHLSLVSTFAPLLCVILNHVPSCLPGFSFLLLSFALSTDTFAAGLSYSAQKVRVPLRSMGIISLVSGFMFTLSLLAGEKLSFLIPAKATGYFSFVLLCALAFYKLYDALPQKFHPAKDMTTASLSEKVNKKEPEILSPLEAALLSAVLSIDSIAAGVSTGAPPLSSAAILLISSAIHFLSLKLGLSAGQKLLEKTSCSFSWLSAVLFFLLAFSKLF